MAERTPGQPFKSRTVAWQDWVAAWERDQTGLGEVAPFAANLRLLPATPNLESRGR